MVKKHILSNIWGYISLALLALIVILLFPGQGYLVKGNIHDLWIPQIAAYALKQGQVLHEQFHTPFGGLYSYLNYLSLNIIEAFPALFSPADMIFLSSVLFSAIFICLFVLVKKNTSNSFISFFLLAFLLSLSFQVRKVSKPFYHNEVLWYASYNSHLWSLILLQICHVLDRFLIFKQLKKSWSGQKDFRLFVFIQAAFVFLCFSYKFNFFLASGAIAASALFFQTRKEALRYVLFAALTFCLFTLGIYLLTEYSYVGYLKDVYHAVESKGKVSSRFFFAFILYSSLLFFFILSKKEVLEQIVSSANFFEPLKKNFLSQNLEDKKKSLRNFAFISFICLAVLIGVIGDWQRPNIFFLFILAMYLIMSQKHRLLTKVSYFFLVAFYLVNLVSLSYVISKKQKSYKVAAAGDKVEEDTGRYVKISLLSENPEIIVKNTKGMAYLYKLLKVGRGSLKNQTFFDLSYSYMPTITSGIPFYNKEYAAMVIDAKDRIESLSLGQDKNVMMLEFVNPLPLLLKSKMMDQNFHWIHMGTTFSFKNIHKIDRLFAQADALYVPIISMDGDRQTFLNCRFFKWNFGNQKFKFYSLNKYGILFLKNSVFKEAGGVYKETQFRSESKISNACKKVEKRIKKIY